MTRTEEYLAAGCSLESAEGLASADAAFDGAGEEAARRGWKVSRARLINPGVQSRLWKSGYRPVLWKEGVLCLSCLGVWVKPSTDAELVALEA